MYSRECWTWLCSDFYFLFVGKDKTQASCLHSLCKCGIKMSGHVIPIQVRGENVKKSAPE